jgi:hypothetical protein
VSGFSTGLVWAGPAAALAAVFTVLPLPRRQPTASPARAADTLASWNDTFPTRTGAGSLLSQDAIKVLHDVKNMTRNFALANNIPVR